MTAASVASRESTTRAVSGDRADAAPLALAPPTLVHRPPRRTSVGLTLRVLGPLAAVTLWWYASRAGWLDPQVLASPGQVADAFAELASSGVLWENLAASLRLAFTGLAIGGSIGITLAVFTGFVRLGDELLDPTLQMLRTVPFIALSPLFIVWFGIDEKPKLVLIAVATAFPLYLNVRGGVRDVDRKTVEAARSYGLGGLPLLREIVVPAALPSLLVGLRISLGVSLLALIFAEQINSTAGIGYLLISAQQYFQTDVMVVCLVVYALWGLIADLSVRLLEWALMPWNHAHKGIRRVPAR